MTIGRRREEDRLKGKLQTQRNKEEKAESKMKAEKGLRTEGILEKVTNKNRKEIM
jgi:hypothetical protein